ncbi:MAG: LamG domain-containing protein [Planctomycetes bacterium]|nr:LamG domain-containing protein [Planctomycetota bacterium]
MFCTKIVIQFRRERLLALLFFIGMLANFALAQNPDPSLIGYWPFDGDGADLSGGNRPLELAAKVGFDTGLFGKKALSVHPGDVDVAGGELAPAFRPVDDPVFNFGANDFTVQAWVNYNDPSGGQVLIEKFSGASGWTVTKTANNVYQFFLDNNAYLNPKPVTIEAGVWNHFLVRRSGTVIEIYFNNTAIGSLDTDRPVPDNTNQLLIGMRRGTPDSSITNGLIDEVAIWNRALGDA